MPNSVQEFFNTLATRRYEPLLHSVSGTVQWNIEEEGKWNVIIDKGTITVNRNAVVADSLMSCNKDILLVLANGAQNPLTAFLQGKLAIDGNVGLALVFQRIFQNGTDKNKTMTNSRRTQ
ncbi:hypothetical protein KSF_007770 [Reticulibacter mediterranei]|uniref:SCP2 domain-containing protein n=1 Tax=Reticulibacter mediterranei TaxID=2778369 RepID=A0A8J3MX98_9CHLR|nr:SCP2 sterol-binding domain-containing protein [Reticulibacter mediterranei]GHO90729.1 hypothetical protein KSF_007770 [Reticulibacter mediterranei]